MSVRDVLDVIPKSWRPVVVVAFLVATIAGGTLATRAFAASYVDEEVEWKVAPLRTSVVKIEKSRKFERAIMRHLFQHVEADEAAHGRPTHTLKDVKHEAETVDDDD